MNRGDKVLINNKEAVIRYSYFDLYKEGSESSYRIAFIRHKTEDGFYEKMIFDSSWHDERELQYIGRLTEEETRFIENYNNLSHEIDIYKTKDRLNASERIQFQNIIEAFSLAKKQKDYKKSDAIRKELALWQRGLSDQDIMDMNDSGKYIFYPYLSEK